MYTKVTRAEHTCIIRCSLIKRHRFNAATSGRCTVLHSLDKWPHSLRAAGHWQRRSRKYQHPNAVAHNAIGNPEVRPNIIACIQRHGNDGHIIARVVIRIESRVGARNHGVVVDGCADDSAPHERYIGEEHIFKPDHSIKAHVNQLDGEQHVPEDRVPDVGHALVQ